MTTWSSCTSHLEDLHGEGLRERIEKHIHTIAHGKAGYTVPLGR